MKYRKAKEEIEEGVEEYEFSKSRDPNWVSPYAKKLIGEGLSRSEAIQKSKKTSFAKRRAREIGLAYWPALLDEEERDVDPLAYVMAEQVLSAHHGYWGKTEIDESGWEVRNWGGWDSYGDRGVSPKFVADAWLAAGCKDGSKFRLQIFHRVLAKKSESVNNYRDLVRGFLWAARRNIWGCQNNRNGGEHPNPINRKALRALGRIPAILRQAAVIGTTVGRSGPIRIRHLNWALVRKAEIEIAKGNKYFLIGLSPANKALELLGHSRDNTLTVGEQLRCALYGRYTTHDGSTVRGMYLGVDYGVLTGGTMTKKEASSWISTSKPDSIKEVINSKVSDLFGEPIRNFDLEVLRWLERCYSSRAKREALKKVRTFPAIFRPGMDQARILDKIDEVSAEDIVGNSVVGVFLAARERVKENFRARNIEDDRPLTKAPEWTADLPEGVTHLQSCKELSEEGTDMEHCVGSYGTKVAKRESVILSLADKNGRSTAELNYSGNRVIQHLGRENGPPPSDHICVIRTIVSNNRRRKSRHERR